MLSIWERTSYAERWHLVVIGGGITGSFAALHYQRRHPAHRVLMVERGAFPNGATVRNAGFACFGSPSEILADIDAEGLEAALTRVEERWRGLRALRAELGDEAIGFEPCGGHELFHASDALYNRVAERFDALNTALRPIFNGPTYEWQDGRKGDLGLRAEHLAFTPLEGAVDSGRLLRALHARAAGAGVVIRTGCAVTSLHLEPEGPNVTLETGEHLVPERLVLATNGYTRQLLPDKDILPARGQVLVTQPLPGLKLRGTFHANEGFYYFRHVGDRVLLGGGRHLDVEGETTVEEGVTDQIQGDLERLLREVILPGRDWAVDLRWSGVMGFRSNGKRPLVERIGPSAVLAAGLSGMGVAIGHHVAAQAVDLLER